MHLHSAVCVPAREVQKSRPIESVVVCLPERISLMREPIVQRRLLLQSQKGCNKSTNGGNVGSVCIAFIGVPDYKFESGQEPTQISEYIFSQELKGSRINTTRNTPR